MSAMREDAFTFESVRCDEWDRRQRYRFLISAVVPRPIGWISTMSAAGVLNLAPFSWFNTVCADPVMVVIAIGRRRGVPKDTAANIRELGEFVVNVATRAVADQMVRTSVEYGPEVNEFERAGLTPIPSREIQPPRVAESPVHLECVLDRIIELGEGATDLVLGRAVRIHYATEVCRDGACDIHLLGAIGRLGGQQYGIIDHVVEIPPPPPDH